MKLTPKAEIPTGPGPAAYFTGAVTIERLHETAPPSRSNAVRVTFPPGARTAWHTHPLGQLLIVTEGEGWAQTEGQPRLVLRPGDVVWIPPGERHWHGATAQSAMTHVAVQEAVDGSAADWQEQVSDADYLG
ncbi:cupin domain-containing protein [Roseicyclus persicicus]|uniref:Cupin domain-containing protein n=1 Tax=Roseicyclus persicicus TaxID=2650661 RepID=A0A7X6GZ08_9RHOB|nr:cupin domain-containing protein [Roseibacterium persicicum]NKX44958.1 cupin domain-containing protein [Roseibacterium persicicum]